MRSARAATDARRRRPLATLVAALLGWVLSACADSTPAPNLDGRVDRAAAVDQLPADRMAPADAPVDVAVPDGSAGSGPPYPIVLAHGFFGFDKVGPLEYFHKVKPALQKNGHTVYVAAVDPFNSTTKVRGPQLLKQVKTILDTSGAARVNIIGHSQGGLDARYVAAHIPDRIGAVATVATPHMGARIADVLLGSAPGFTIELAKAFFKAVSRPFYGDIAKDANMKACLQFLSTSSVTAFNASYPDQPQVAYYSIGGRSNSDLATTVCFAPKAPPFITKHDKHKDPVDPMLYVVSKVVGESLLDPEPNDGLVQVTKTKWGTWLGCIPADHWDEVGQLLGDSPGWKNPFDHIAFYRALAKFLVSEGY